MPCRWTSIWISYGSIWTILCIFDMFPKFKRILYQTVYPTIHWRWVACWASFNLSCVFMETACRQSCRSSFDLAMAKQPRDKTRCDFLHVSAAINPKKGWKVSCEAFSASTHREAYLEHATGNGPGNGEMGQGDSHGILSTIQRTTNNQK